MSRRKGHLVIIGGAEDRHNDKTVLSRVVELSGGCDAHIVVLTTASRLVDEDAEVAREVEEMYEAAFRACGTGHVDTLHIHDRRSASEPEHVARISAATGVFMAGGDQSRLVRILGGTPVARAMRDGFERRGLCVAGTSAGASAVSEHMMVGGTNDILPKKGIVPLSPGLGFLHNVIIDQHFSQRQRLPRLLSVLAQNPFLIGVGIDEDTALIVTPDAEIEVVGSGTVTILDGRAMVYTNVNEVENGDVLALGNIQLNMLPAGFHFALETGRRGDRSPTSEAFAELIATVVATR